MGTDRAAFLAAFDEIGAFLDKRVGHTLFSVSRAVPGGAEVERIYSSMPSNYPVGGRNRVDTTAWTQQMARGECFVANAPEQFGPHFHNLETIVAEGFGAVINIPVHHGPRLLGTLNLLHRAGAYGGDVLPACRAARVMAIDAYLDYEKFLSQQSPLRST
jgi:hypothetical protein